MRWKANRNGSTASFKPRMRSAQCLTVDLVSLFRPLQIRKENCDGEIAQMADPLSAAARPASGDPVEPQGSGRSLQILVHTSEAPIKQVSSPNSTSGTPKSSLTDSTQTKTIGSKSGTPRDHVSTPREQLLRESVAGVSTSHSKASSVDGGQDRRETVEATKGDANRAKPQKAQLLPEERKPRRTADAGQLLFYKHHENAAGYNSQVVPDKIWKKLPRLIRARYEAYDEPDTKVQEEARKSQARVNLVYKKERQSELQATTDRADRDKRNQLFGGGAAVESMGRLRQRKRHARYARVRYMMCNAHHAL